MGAGRPFPQVRRSVRLAQYLQSEPCGPRPAVPLGASNGATRPSRTPPPVKEKMSPRTHPTPSSHPEPGSAASLISFFALTYAVA